MKPFDWEKNAVYWHDTCEQAWRERDLANLTIKEKDAEIAALRQERDELKEVNHSVRVCAGHTEDIIEDGPCVICELQEAEQARDALTAELEQAKALVGWCDDAARGIDVSEFALSFVPVQQVADLRASLQSLTAALTTLEGEWRSIAIAAGQCLVEAPRTTDQA